ncbi:MAG: ABC transporter ATP-binding protein [Christensenellaceae bacterium]|jgi:putative ABC transport system ATP-binding protein
MSIVLECNHLTKVFRQGVTDVVAVNDATLAFAPGIHMIVGKSGCGKSTLLHMLAGLEEPTRGNVLYGEYDLYQNKSIKYLKEKIRRRHFGFIYQSYNLISELRVKDNIMMPVYLNGEKESPRFDEIIEVLDIEDKLKQLPSTLSGGEQQRVAIARAVINGPDILFADEPTGNLDEENGRAVMQLLIDVAERFNATLIMVTHDQDLLQYADHIYDMADGIIVKREEKVA